MKTVILCGGRGTRLNELGTMVPKALVEVGEKPIIWHLLKLFSSHGFNDFALCLGYLGDQIKGYFVEGNSDESWNVGLYDTGLDTNTGGRLKRIEGDLAGEETFLVTYGDGLADVNLSELLAFHRAHGKIATLTAVHPISNYGLLDIGTDGEVVSFREKPALKEWINGGFFVFDREIFEHLDENSILEREPLEALAEAGELMAYSHLGFWKCMDTYKDSVEFNQLWETGAPWKRW